MIGDGFGFGLWDGIVWVHALECRRSTLARTLELIDVSGDRPVATGDTATLSDEGSLSFQGDGVKQILAPWVRDNSPEDLFNNFRGWSNGYVSLRERA